MAVMDQRYGKQLRNFSDSQLTGELREVLDTIKEELNQRTRDRGCYLILENIRRVPETDQEGLLKNMLEANPNPSRGVREKLLFWYRFFWEPKETPAAPILATLIGKISGAGPFLVWWVERYGNELSESFLCEIKEILVAQDKHAIAADLDRLAPIYVNLKKDIGKHAVG